MYKPKGLDRKSLQTRLETYKLIAEVNTELFVENLFTKAELPRKLELAQSYISESYQWEELGDPTKSHDALTNADMMIMEVGAEIKYVLSQDISSDDSDLQPDQSLVL